MRGVKTRAAAWSSSVRTFVVGAWLSLAISVSLGCAGGDDPIDRFVALGPRYMEVFCACPAAAGAGYPDEASCREELAERIVTTEQERCLRAAYEAYPRALEPVLACEVDVEEALLDCAERVLRTCPPRDDDRIECNIQYDRDLEACPTARDSVAERVANCLAR